MLVQDEGNGKYTKRPDKIERYLINIISRYLEEIDITNKTTRESIIQEIMKRIQEDLDGNIINVIENQLPNMLPGVVFKMNSYVLNQDIPLSHWNVMHGLKCKYPIVTLTDVDGYEISGEVKYIDNDTLQVSFNIPVAGVCVCYGVGY